MLNTETPPYYTTSNSDALNKDLQRFNGLSQDAVARVEQFSQQFENHARILSEATTLLDNSHGVFAEKIEERQNALNALAYGLVAKSEEIAEAVQACEQIISTIMKRTEEGARTSSTQIQASLSEMMVQASSRFEGATEEIRKSAEEIREELARTRADLSRGVRTLPSQTKEYTEAMRKAVVEQVDALKELSSIVEKSGRLFDVSAPSSQAEERLDVTGFGSSGGDIYANPRPRMATRAALSPELKPVASSISDTSASSHAPVEIRGGQNGSSGIGSTVSVQGGTDQGGTGFASGLAPSSSPMPPFIQVGTPSQAGVSLGSSGFMSSASSVAPTPVLTPQLQNDVAVDMKPRSSSSASDSDAVLSPQTPNPAAQRGQQGSQSVAATANVSSRSGWVSDLLARASHDESDKSETRLEVAPLTTGNHGETLNSMSGDIVQGIDHDMIVQLWQHYRRGQRNINAAKLYTEEGAKTFEKIKHKYALDGEFRRAVSQYITDFERLLGDVSKNGGNNNTMREYLTSETGKVYTMLAHASGRIQ